MATPIGNAPSVLTMINGYTPFTPDAGIFCGGYQGPLYPNPSTFIIPEFVFDVLPFQNPVATAYTMKNTGDVYDSGFGIGNPGIKHRNPGHILGIIDTFGRMSYGLGIIKAARQGIQSFDIDPVADISLPFTKLLSTGGSSPVTIGSSNLYPAYSEIPSDYLKRFVVNQILVLDPRTAEPYVFDGAKNVPDTAEIGLEFLFRNVLSRSYIGLPESLRAYFSILTQEADNFNTQTVLTLTSNRLGGTGGQLLVDLPNPIEDVAVFPTGDNTAVFLEDADLYGPYEYINKCKSLSVLDSLKLMTGTSEFHQINETKYEYRSLTELNSVINILPVQINGLKYYYTIDTASNTYPSYDLVGGIVFVSYFICDICINTFQKKTISIDFTANITSQDDVTSALNHRNVLRQFLFSHSLTNKFSWDRKWFGLPDKTESGTESQSNFYISQSLKNGFPPDAADQSFATLPTTTNFNRGGTFTPEDGLNTIRARIIVKSKALIEFGQPTVNGYEQLNLDLNINGENIALSVPFTQS